MKIFLLSYVWFNVPPSTGGRPAVFRCMPSKSEILSVALSSALPLWWCLCIFSLRVPFDDDDNVGSGGGGGILAIVGNGGACGMETDDFESVEFNILSNSATKRDKNNSNKELIIITFIENFLEVHYFPVVAALHKIFYFEQMTILLIFKTIINNNNIVIIHGNHVS